MTLTPVSPPESREESLPEDRTGIQQYVRSRVLEIAEKTADLLADCSDPPSLDGLVASYESRAEQWASEEAFWDGSFCDFLEHAVTSGNGDTGEADLENRIDSLSLEITRLAPFPVSPCPIANQADSAKDIYAEYPQIADVCGFLKCPVIQSGNTDFLVLTSLNPCTTKLTADIVREILFRDTGAMPFVFSTTCPLKTRDYLCARHFVHES